MNDFKRLSAENFIKNNGIVLRTVNILRYKFNKLTGVHGVVKEDGISESEFLDSINFLSEEGYIQLRDIASKASANLADDEYKRLEAKVTAQGIRLLAGGITDNMIEV